MAGVSLRIGLDFDNTLVSYSKIFYEMALSRGWIPKDTPVSKEAVKKVLVEADGDDKRWQALQAEAYGKRILKAEAYPGSLEFVRRAIENGCEVFLVSHKTENSNYDPTVALRRCAVEWLKEKGFVNNGSVMPEANIHFASTCEGKIARIKELKLDLFIDDMIDVLEHPSFPRSSLPVHFVPENLEASPCEGKVLVLHSWKALSCFADVLAEIGVRPSRAVIKRFGSHPCEAVFLRSTGNNRLYRVRLDDGRKLMLKVYLRDARDPRRRSLAEFSALSMLWENGITNVPRPYIHDEENGFAVFSQIEGEAMRDKSVSREHVKQAVAFLHSLGALHLKTLGEDIREGADSRKCLGDYLRHVDRRLAGIRNGVKKQAGGERAAELVENSIIPLRERIVESFKAQAVRDGVDLEAIIPEEERILSPSDFGFHNALLDPAGKIHFVDFEYFGRDDPAKLVADFIHHAGQELSVEHKRLFLESFFEGFAHRDSFLKRLRLVLDIIGLEWLLIILNVLDPVQIARRKFSSPQADEREIVDRRLKAAQARIKRMAECEKGGGYRTVPLISSLLSDA